MKLTGLHIFLILLASIVFCACLGDDKKVVEGAVGHMDEEDEVETTSTHESRRHDNVRRERREREMDRELKRELNNYKREQDYERREHEERIKRLERRDRQARARRREKRSRRSEDDDYDQNDEIYRRMNEERFQVDDHRHKRRTRNRARMHPIPGRRMPHPDKYMLKSEVVPPVCPACPGGGGGGGGGGANNNPPQPCPPCARCPEPAFECKKVPNYNSTNTSGLPKPVLSDFSTFGA